MRYEDTKTKSEHDGFAGRCRSMTAGLEGQEYYYYCLSQLNFSPCRLFSGTKYCGMQTLHGESRSDGECSWEDENERLRGKSHDGHASVARAICP
jgi:hypothetical protein